MKPKSSGAAHTPLCCLCFISKDGLKRRRGFLMCHFFVDLSTSDKVFYILQRPMVVCHYGRTNKLKHKQTRGIENDSVLIRETDDR